jgi:hypothetical protein
MNKNKRKKYSISRQKPLMTQPADVYYNGKKLEYYNENHFVDELEL